MSELLSYARAALPLIPGASRLPFVAGSGREMPPLERSRIGVRVERDALARYAEVCGFAPSDTLPPTYLHVRAFPLHMQLMTDGRFPFPAIGLVHLANRIAVHRPANNGETFDLHVHATDLQSHPKGQTFALVTEARVGKELVWEGNSTMLRRGGAADGRATDAGATDAGAADGRAADGQAADVDRAGGARGDASADSSAEAPRAATGPARSTAGPERWELPHDLGRKYAAASGDRNPIHLHPLTARLFGFPKPIAHGMWTKARCLAALEQTLPDAFTVEVAFRKPIFLPGAVELATSDGAFVVHSAKDPHTIHLEGTIS